MNKLASNTQKKTAVQRIVTKSPDGTVVDVPVLKDEICKKDKLCILGTAGSMPMAPFADESFEIWGVSPVVTYEQCKRWDVLFELHTSGYWSRKDITERLAKVDVPLYMLHKQKQFKTSVEYPLDDILQYGRYHTTTISYMLALALHSFKTTGKPYHLAMFGVHMESDEEYQRQRPCVEHWIGQLMGAGVDVFIPPGGAILTAHGLYGYENYNPVCFDLKARIQGLQMGEKHEEDARNEAEGRRHQQMGAIKEAQFWLDKFQKGEIQTDESTLDPNIVAAGRVDT